MLREKEKAVKGLTSGIAMLFKSNKVTHIKGHGTIANANQINVAGPDGQQTVKAKNILIATGSEVTPFAVRFAAVIVWLRVEYDFFCRASQ